MSVIIYHHPTCSKSRQTLTLLQQQGIDPHIIYYLEHQFNVKELTELKEKLQLNTFREMMRIQDNLYFELSLDGKHISEQQLLEAIIQYPALLQRPIVVVGDKAKIGRPPKSTLSLL